MTELLDRASLPLDQRRRFLTGRISLDFTHTGGDRRGGAVGDPAHRRRSRALDRIDHRARGQRHRRRRRAGAPTAERHQPVGSGPGRRASGFGLRTCGSSMLPRSPSPPTLTLRADGSATARRCPSKPLCPPWPGTRSTSSRASCATGSGSAQPRTAGCSWSMPRGGVTGAGARCRSAAIGRRSGLTGRVTRRRRQVGEQVVAVDVQPAGSGTRWRRCGSPGPGTPCPAGC